MLRSYKFGSRPFDTFARHAFLRLARSCRVVEKFDKNHWFFVIFCRSGPEKRSIGSDFSATRQDLDKRRKILSANVLNFVLPHLERLSPTEHRVLPARLSDFAEKLCFLALGSEDRLAVFVMPARSGALNVVADASIHFLRGIVSVWLNCVASMRNVK